MQNVLSHLLSVSIRRLSKLGWSGLLNGKGVRLAINSARGRMNNMLYAILIHTIKHI